MKRTFALVASACLMVALVVSSGQAAQASGPAKPEKVTICHRTHSVTNPYRMITVSKSAVNGPLNTYTLPNSSAGTQFSSDGGDHAGYLHNGYKLYHGQYVPKYDVNPKVFTPSPSANYPAYDGTSHAAGDFSGYSGPNKVWQDIIPPFSVDVAKGSLKVGSYAGLNWSDEGKAIYFGTGNAFGLCKKMTAKEFYTAEVTDGGLTPSEALKEIRDDNAEEDGGLKPNSLNELPNTPSHPAGPTPPTDLPSLTQAIGGKVWYDDNHNGLQDGGEAAAPGVAVELLDPNNYVAPTGIESGSPAQNSTPGIQTASVRTQSVPCVESHVGTVWTVCTNADGDFYFNGVPEGIWSVTVIRPDGYTYTYDSSEASDGLAPTLVPAGGAGYMWAGLIDPANAGNWVAPDLSTPSASGEGTGQLPNTGQPTVPLLFGGALVVVLGALILGWVSRRRRFDN